MCAPSRLPAERYIPALKSTHTHTEHACEAHTQHTPHGARSQPGSLGTIFGAPLCGWLSDRLAARYGGTAVRLVPGTLASLLVLPPALAGFGWSLAAGNLPVRLMLVNGFENVQHRLAGCCPD